MNTTWDFFFMEMKVLICYSENIKKKHRGLNAPSQKIIVLSFQNLLPQLR